MIQVAVIGFGFMGITHALNIQKNNKLNLRAIITRHGEAIAGRLRQQIGNFSSGQPDAERLLKIPVYKTLRECLAHEKIDAVQVCVHTDLHFEIAREAMESGLHVFLEKPLTLQVGEGRRLIEYARHQKVKFMVGHVVRFMPAYQKLKEWIGRKTYGSLKFISLTRFTGTPSWGQWKEKQEKFGSSGGALFDLVIHDIDFLHYVLGEPAEIDPVYYPGALSKHDYLVAHWYYPYLTAKIEGGNIFHSLFPFQAGYIASFEKASVMYSSLKPEFIQVSTNETSVQIVAGDANEGFYNEIEYFADCIIGDTEPVECSPASSLRTVELCYAHLK